MKSHEINEVNKICRFCTCYNLYFPEFELTSANSLFSFIQTEDGHNIYFESFFEGEKVIESVINIYKNKKQLFAIIGDTDYLLTEMKEFLKLKHNEKVIRPKDKLYN